MSEISGNRPAAKTGAAAPARALMPDWLRLVALFGIVVVNVQFIAYPTPLSVAEPPGNVGADAVAHWLVNGLATLKVYGLFSFMFGVGLGFQMRSAEHRGLPIGQVHRNRMAGLFLFGVVHGCLLFPGDILAIYAVAGSFIPFMRHWNVRRLVRAGAALLAAQAVIAPTLLAVLPASPAEVAELERATLTGGTFVEAVILRSIGFAVIFPIFLIIQGIAALGWFCLGLAAVNSGMIDSPGHPLWSRARRLCLVPGVVAGLASAAVWEWGDPVLGTVLTTATAPLATIGYLGLIAWLAQATGPLTAPFLAAGGSSLSVYLGQSIILTTVFSGYGLGLWDGVGKPTAIAIALASTAALILALSLWRRRFAHGPFEWALRRITYVGVRASAHRGASG